MSEKRDFRFYFGAASTNQRKALRKLEEPNVMISYATDRNKPWDGIERLFVDSGGYSFMMGQGEFGPLVDYLDYLEHYEPDLFALRDYPCEPDVLEKYGRTVEDHQRMTLDGHLRTLEAFHERDIDSTPVTVLQGWEPNDYLEHLDMMKDHGLIGEYVAMGTLCRRGQIDTIRQIIPQVARELPTETKLHAFGIKMGVLQYPEMRHYLDSADSCAYDYGDWFEIEGTVRWQDSAVGYWQMKRQLMDSRTDKTEQKTLSEAF